MKPRSIAQAARDAGVGVETIRFYERRGLIARPARPAQGARRYPDETIVRLHFIHEAQTLGFTLAHIAELLALRADPEADCADVHARAVARRMDVRRRIAQLKRIANALDAVIAACPNRGAIGACSILDAIDRHTLPAKAQSAPRRTAHPSRNGDPAMKTVIFSIDGMRCEGCAETVRALLQREAGVKAVQVSHAPGSARVLFDPQAMDEDRLKAIISRPGYRVTDAR